MRSSYFPHSKEESDYFSESSSRKIYQAPISTSSNCQRGSTLHPDTHSNDAQLPVIYPTHNHNDGLVHFPSNTKVLWDRTALAPPIYITPVDALPNLVLGCREVQKLLSLLDQNQPMPNNQSVAKSFNANAYIYHSQNLPRSYQDLVQLLSRGIVSDRSDYFLSFERHQLGDLQLTIPISRGNGQQNPISALQDNLWRSISSCKDFGIKHFMRIRAHGALTTNESYSRCFSEAENAANKTGMMRFEALVPNVTLQILPIHPLPILSTAMSSVVFDSNTSIRIALPSGVKQNMSPNNRVDARLATLEASNMGYLTLNQTRKIVLLSESDASLTSTPVVGVWVRLAPSSTNNSQVYDLDWKQLARHPFCWAACVRFMYHNRIGERVCVAQDTFLMSVLVGDSTYFCEVTATVGNSDSPGLSSDNLPASISFMHLDFTASLSTDSDIDMERSGDQLGGVICRFKPVQTPFLALPAHRQRRSQTESPPSGEINAASPQRYNLLSPTRSAESMPDVTSTSSPIVATSILPNAKLEISVQRSFEVPPGAYSALQTARKNELQQQQLSACSQNSLPVDYCHDATSSSRSATCVPKPAEVEAVSSGMFHSEANLQYRFPAEIITAQQRQIQQLQEEVASLKEMIRVMSTFPSFNATPTMPLQATTVSGGSGIVDNQKGKNSSRNDDVSLLFDSFQRQVINVLRASQESDRNRDADSSPIPILPGTESENASYEASNTNIQESKFDSKEKENYEGEYHNEDDDEVELISNNKDYDEGEVQLYVRRNFRPIYMSRVPPTTAASDDVPSAQSSSNLSEKSPSKSPLQDVPKKRIPKVSSNKKKKEKSFTAKSSADSTAAKKLSSEDLSEFDISRETSWNKFPTPVNEEDEIAAAAAADFNEDNKDMDYDVDEVDMLLNGSTSGTDGRFVSSPPRSKALASSRNAINATGKTDTSRWENREKSFRESESILAIESKYR